MIRSTRRQDKPIDGKRAAFAGSLPASDTDETPYGPVFWLCYLANMLLIVATAVLYRYADFVTYLGGTEWDLGLIVGIGMVGALLMRGLQGTAMDHYGTRRIWLLSLALYVASLLAHLPITRIDGPAVFLVRILMMTSLAGTFGASVTYVSLRAPPRRMPEMIGVLGSSGFFGIALGPVLGDWLLSVPHITRLDVDRMFLLAAAMGAASLVCAALATRGQVHMRPSRRPPMFSVVRRYHPGPILLIGAVMGVGVGLPVTFLRTFAAELDIPRIQVFFLVYAATAFTLRILTRRLPELIGIRPMILIALGFLSASMLLYLVVSNEYLLAAPAVAGGVAHALLFPAVVGGGSAAFPRRYRGLGTTTMLAMFDCGCLVGQPAVGGLVEVSKRWGLPPYPTMFTTVAAAIVAAGVFYAVADRFTKPYRRNLPHRRKSTAFHNAIPLPASPRTRTPDTLPAAREACESSGAPDPSGERSICPERP